MIKIEHIVTASPEQMEFIIEGMRNPMNSWEKSDSYAGHENMGAGNEYFHLGENDHSLMQRLSNAGTDDRKFMRMMPVYVRITAPLYWYAEMDTYKVGTVRNSCSFMHKGVAKEFTINDFSLKDERIYSVLNPLDKKSYALRYPYETTEFRTFKDHNGRSYKVFRNGYVLREAFDYVDGYGSGRKRHFDEAPAVIHKNRTGYFVVKLSGRDGGSMLLSRMVAAVWLDKPEGCNQVDHINGDKGDNSVENLEWVNAKENVKRGVALGLYDRLGSLHSKYLRWKNGATLIPPEKRAAFALAASRGWSYKELATAYDITPIQANQARYGMQTSGHEDLFQECFMWECIIQQLNYMRASYLETKDSQVFQAIRSLVPQGYMQTSNIMLNYEVLANIYKSRKNHKLDEWREFCKWIETLPYSELITGDR